MKPLIVVAISAILSYLAAYLAGAFIAWDFDASQWDAFGRAMALVLGGLATFIMSVLALAAMDSGKHRPPR